MKYVFIVNPVSGHKDKEAIFSRIRSAFRLIDDEMIVEETDHSGHAREIATAYATKYGDRCVMSAVAATAQYMRLPTVWHIQRPL